MPDSLYPFSFSFAVWFHSLKFSEQLHQRKQHENSVLDDYIERSVI